MSVANGDWSRLRCSRSTFVEVEEQTFDATKHHRSNRYRQLFHIPGAQCLTDHVGPAHDEHWYDPDTDGPFHFALVYTLPGYQAREYDTLRERRSEQVLTAAIKDGGVRLQDVTRLMRDHYEGTPYYFNPPHESPYRNIEISRTVTSVIVHLRDHMPPPLGALAWISLSPPATTTYLPFHQGIRWTGKSARTGVAYDGIEDFDPSSAWWSFSVIRRLTEQNWSRNYPVVRRDWKRFEDRTIAASRDVDQIALKAWRRGDHSLARNVVTRFSAKTLRTAVEAAHRLRGWFEGLCPPPRSPWSTTCPVVTDPPVLDVE